MGIKYLTKYLNDSPCLKHEISFTKDRNENGTSIANKGMDTNERKLIIWDCLGWMRNLYGARGRTSKLFTDFRFLNRRCKQIIDTFNLFGFELVAFVDGYYCKHKYKEKRRRKQETLRKIRKNIKLIKQLHETDKTQHKAIINKLEFVPSSGYHHFIEQILSHNRCKVYRGSGNHDIDKDIAQFVVDHKDKIYAILSVDTDYFGFFDVPIHCKIISEFRVKQQKSLSFVYYYSSELWNTLGLNTNEQRLQLICVCGNDFIKKRSKESILRGCGIEVEEKEYIILDIVAQAIKENTLVNQVNIPDVIREFYSTNAEPNCDMFCENINVVWTDLMRSNVFHAGFFFHDIDANGFSIHQKLADIRHALIHKHLKLDRIDEYIPFVMNESKEDNVHIDVYHHLSIDLKGIKYERNDWDLCLFTKRRGFNDANLFVVFKRTLGILIERRWIDNIQYIALELQFEIRHSLRNVYGGKWPFHQEFQQFKKDGIPQIKDLTAQSLYWECCRLLCLNPNNILPNICQLFDGALFHFFCYEQMNGDKARIITDLKSALNREKQSYHEKKKYQNKHKRYRRNVDGMMNPPFKKIKMDNNLSQQSQPNYFHHQQYQHQMVPQYNHSRTQYPSQHQQLLNNNINHMFNNEHREFHPQFPVHYNGNSHESRHDSGDPSHLRRSRR